MSAKPAPAARGVHRSYGCSRTSVCCSLFFSAILLLLVPAGSLGAAPPTHPRSDSCRASDLSVSGLLYDSDDDAFIDPASLLPPLVRDQISLKRYLRDPRFRALRRLCNDTIAADAIFMKAMEIADGDIRHALLVAMFGAMDHFRLGLRIPFFGVLNLPLTTESDSTFRVRHENLPGHILQDSIGRAGTDRDKLQHFFGSAFVRYFTNSSAIATLLGDFVEEGEAAFVAGGANDERDQMANRLGREFGRRLLEGEDVMPSDVLWKKR